MPSGVSNRTVPAVPPTNLPLSVLPFLSSSTSARALSAVINITGVINRCSCFIFSLGLWFWLWIFPGGSWSCLQQIGTQPGTRRRWHGVGVGDRDPFLDEPISDRKQGR